jgi:hypothetical protein
MLSTVTHHFFQEHLSHLPLYPLSNLLEISNANGSLLPYYGYVEVSVGCSFTDDIIKVALLVVPNTGYNSKIPILVGTNILHALRESTSDCQIPKPWKWAISSLSTVESSLLGTVLTTQPSTISPNSKVTVHGLCHGVSSSRVDTIAEGVPGRSLPGD